MNEQLRVEVGLAIIQLGKNCVDNGSPAMACVLGVAANALLDGSDTELLKLVSAHSSVPAKLRQQVEAVLGETENYNN